MMRTPLWSLALAIQFVICLSQAQTPYYYVDVKAKNATGDGRIENPFREIPIVINSNFTIYSTVFKNVEFALFAYGSNVTVIAATFTNITTPKENLALITVYDDPSTTSSSSVTFRDSTFQSLSNARAVATRGVGLVTFENVRMFNNVLTRNQTLLELSAASVVFNSSSFISNKGIMSGVVHTLEGTSLSVVNCMFELNEGSVGGGIYAQGGQNASVQIVDSEFVDNSASLYGSAFAIQKGDTTQTQLSGLLFQCNRLQGDQDHTPLEAVEAELPLVCKNCNTSICDVHCAHGEGRVDNVVCFACGPGRGALDGYNCTKCPPGTFAADRYGGCKPCAEGTYAGSEGSTYCDTCTGSMMTAGIGASSCNQLTNFVIGLILVGSLLVALPLLTIGYRRYCRVPQRMGAKDYSILRPSDMSWDEEDEEEEILEREHERL
eukprot:Colp12_sorted_trinity150504_noHs@25222